MSNVTRIPPNQPAVGELLALNDEEAQTRVIVAPQRGALVTSFQVGERELLYLDTSTLNDASKNVRGGIPVLFPSPGKLAGDTWRYAGKSGAMKQHGFARNLPWTVSSTSDAPASVVLALEANAATLAQFPWSFRAELTLTLTGTRLRIVFRARNDAAEEMPFALGYHPYFLVTDKSRAAIDTRATRAFDNVHKREIPFQGFELEAEEVDLHLLDHGSSASALHYGDGSMLSITGSSAFSRWVVWTLANKEFVCLEPWTAPGDALNAGEHLFTLAPGASQECWLDIEFSG